MNTQAMQRSNGPAPALTLWTEADIDHVRQTIAPQANDQEFRLLIYMANKYQLDPLLRQIWCVKYGTKPAQIFAGRDGFLAIAHRTGAFDGLETVIRVESAPLDVTYRENGQTAHFTRDYQYVATARAYNKGAHHPVTVEVWEEEYSTGQNLWLTKPRTMLTKVAECQAVRKAFNISGLYDPAEMGHEEAIESTAREIPPESSAPRAMTAPAAPGAAQSGEAATQYPPAPKRGNGASPAPAGTQPQADDADRERQDAATKRVFAVLRRRDPQKKWVWADVTQEFAALVDVDTSCRTATVEQWEQLAEALEAESPDLDAAAVLTV